MVLSFVCRILLDIIESADIRKQIIAQFKAQAQIKAQAKETERLSHIEDGYRSPAGYRRGVKED